MAATSCPIDVAARMIGMEAPAAAAGTNPTLTRPRATDPTRNAGTPIMPGSPMAGVGGGGGAAIPSVGSSVVCGSTTWLPAPVGRAVVWLIGTAPVHLRTVGAGLGLVAGSCA